LAFLLASASQAGSVDTCGESAEGKRFVTAGGDGVESEISTDNNNNNKWSTSVSGAFFLRHHFFNNK